jgi:hypothetical protein
MSMDKERITLEVPARALHIEHARCSHGHSLMDPEVPINGLPSIKVIIQYGAIRGAVHLDPVYGSFHNLFDVDIPEGVVVEMFCPTCGTSLRYDKERCDYCFSPEFALYLPNGGLLVGCLKCGCHQHKLTLVNVHEQLGMVHGRDQIQLLL